MSIKLTRARVSFELLGTTDDARVKLKIVPVPLFVLSHNNPVTHSQIKTLTSTRAGTHERTQVQNVAVSNPAVRNSTSCTESFITSGPRGVVAMVLHSNYVLYTSFKPNLNEKCV